MHFEGLTGTRGTRAYFTLAARAVADLSDIRSAFAEMHEQAAQFLEGMIARGQREGCIRNDVDARGAALAIGNLLLGASMQHITDPETNTERLTAATLSLTAAALG